MKSPSEADTEEDVDLSHGPIPDVYVDGVTAA